MRAFENRDAEWLAAIPADGSRGSNNKPWEQSCCSAAIAPQAARLCWNNANKINALNGYYAILTCHDAVSMVRAAFEGGGAISTDRGIV
jgi:hypothetical protein